MVAIVRLHVTVSFCCYILEAAVTSLSPHKARASAMLILSSDRLQGNENPTSSSRLETFDRTDYNRPYEHSSYANVHRMHNEPVVSYSWATLQIQARIKKVENYNQRIGVQLSAGVKDRLVSHTQIGHDTHPASYHMSNKGSSPWVKATRASISCRR